MPKYQILILAAGKGTRMRSELPKILHRVCGAPIINRLLQVSTALNPSQIVVVTGFEAEKVEAQITSAMKDISCPVKFARQVQQRGTGDAVDAALSSLNADRVLILPGDMPIVTELALREILSGDESLGMPEVTVVSSVPPSPLRYGRIIRDETGRFIKIVEHKDASEAERALTEINTSLYCVDVNFLRFAVEKLETKNAQNERYLTDIVAIALASGKRAEAFRVSDHLPYECANDRAELAALEAARRAQINRQWMEAGISMEDASSTYIDEQVKIGPDTYLGAGTRLYGATTIGEKVEIEGSCIIRDSRIGDDTKIFFGSHIVSGQIGKNCKIGPYARIRPESVLSDDVHIGNFVETKKTTLKRGAKANHLTYLGDAFVGEDVNVGAGTITCNYDGYNKFRTEIGDGAFIGSNTALVAPVVIGAGSVVGAGSVITQDVPEDALALERNKQSVIPGWAEERRTRKRN